MMKNPPTKPASIRRLAIGAALTLGLGLVGMAPNANATLMITAMAGAVPFSCFDNQSPCDTNNAIGTLALSGTLNLGGLIVNSSTETSSGTVLTPGGNPTINTTSLSVINTTSSAITVSVAVGDNNFIGPVQSSALSGSGTFQNATGGAITLRWFDDPTNQQGALTSSATVQPGTTLDTFSHTAAGPADSFAFNDTQAVTDGALFGMTETFTFTLPGGTGACSTTNLSACPQLISRGQTEIKFAAPEPASLALLGAGLATIGVVRRRKSA